MSCAAALSRSPGGPAHAVPSILPRMGTQCSFLRMTCGPLALRRRRGVSALASTVLAGSMSKMAGFTDSEVILCSTTGRGRPTFSMRAYFCTKSQSLMGTRDAGMPSGTNAAAGGGGDGDGGRLWMIGEGYR